VDEVGVEAVGRRIGVADLPHLGRALGDDRVDAVRVHRPPVDLRAAELELAGGLGVGRVGAVDGGEPVGDLGGRVELVRRPKLEQVERVVAALVAGERERRAQVGREAAQDGLLAGLDLDHDLGPLARRQLEAVGLVRPLEQPGVARHLRERPAVREAEVVDPGVRGVQHPEPDPLGRDLEVRVVGAVDQDRVSQRAQLLRNRSLSTRSPSNALSWTISGTSSTP
jgi:hypothetical protein